MAQAFVREKGSEGEWRPVTWSGMTFQSDPAQLNMMIAAMQQMFNHLEYKVEESDGQQ